jgi:glucose/arabinose dehydrogenase
MTPVFDGPDAGRERIEVTLVPFVTEVPQPTDVVEVPGHPGRAIVLSKTGTAWLVDVQTGSKTRWFEVDVKTSIEMGLLGIAFSPTFATDGTLYVNSNPTMVTRVARWQVDPATLERPLETDVLLEVPQPYANHNAGQLAFGPDGMLYVGFGDGGSRNDPHDHGQDRTTMLGSMLRIDVAGDGAYRVPPDNPWVGVAGVPPETWAYGLRNPWRYSFDPQGRLVVADVGQNRFEEIDLVARGDNLGWKVREAEHCFEPETGCATEGMVDPIWSYGRDEGISVTGGFVWTASGALSGHYVFGDYGSGRLWALELPDSVRRVADVKALGRFPGLQPAAFGRAPDGTLWVCDFGSDAVYRIVL